MTQQGSTLETEKYQCTAFNFDRTNLSFRAVQASQEQHIKDRAGWWKIMGTLNNVKNIVILANLNTNLEWVIEDQIVT